MNARDLLATALLLSLLGCATTPVPTSAARDVPRTRVLNATLLERKEGLGQVVENKWGQCNFSAAHALREPEILH
jgi:hypothetical protein